MIPTSYWRDSWGSFVRPNSGSFDILDIACLQEPASRRIVHLYQLDVRCVGCTHAFSARDGHGLSTVTGARVLRCPACSASQAVANVELMRLASVTLPPVSVPVSAARPVPQAVPA